MRLFTKVALSLALAASFTTSAFASVTQTTTPVNYSSSGWHNDLLSSVDFADGTNNVSAFSSVVTIKDQGWGGQDPNGNQVYVGLFDNGVQLWSQHIAGAFHDWTTQTYDILTDAAALNSLNLQLGAIDWSASHAVSLQMRSSTIGYPGWQLFVQNASFSVTSDVPEPTVLALLGLGLAGLAMSRRKSVK